MGRVHSFEPIEDRNSEVLILGSMPGRVSLTAGEYYAHPRNVFWRIISELLQFDATSAYERRVQALKSARIALWDVLQSCTREGSLDAMIENDTLIANDFRTFFRTHKGIKYVFFMVRKQKLVIDGMCYARSTMVLLVTRASRPRVRLTPPCPSHVSLKRGR